MARFKNINWQVHEDEQDSNAVKNCHEAALAVLMDLRDELQSLNRLLSCYNVTRGFLALSKIAARDERTFKRRVADAARKRDKRRSRG